MLCGLYALSCILFFVSFLLSSFIFTLVCSARFCGSLGVELGVLPSNQSLYSRSLFFYRFSYYCLTLSLSFLFLAMFYSGPILTPPHESRITTSIDPAVPLIVHPDLLVLSQTCMFPLPVHNFTNHSQFTIPHTSSVP